MFYQILAFKHFFIMKLVSRTRDTLTRRFKYIFVLALLCLLILYFFKDDIIIKILNIIHFFQAAQIDDSNIYNDAALDSIINRPVARKFSIMSVSMVNKNNFYYILYAPICALAWRRIGYEPLLLIIKEKDQQLNELTAKAVEYLDRFKVKVIYVDSVPDHEKQVAMLSRLFVGILPETVVQDDDFILTTDTDFMPINKEYFNFLNTDAISILDARNKKFMFKGKKYEIPEILIPYIGMKKSQWREVMRLDNNDKLNGEIVIKRVNEIVGEDSFTTNSKMKRGDSFWFLDQRTITIAINEYLKKSGKEVKMNKFPYKGLRLDRGILFTWWTILEHFDRITDAHLFHSNSFDYKKHSFAFFNKVFSPKIVSILEKYFNEFQSIVSV